MLLRAVFHVLPPPPETARKAPGSLPLPSPAPRLLIWHCPPAIGRCCEMWKWPFQAGCKCFSHASIKKSPGPRHISVLESCKTNLAPLPSWMWLRGSGLRLVLWPEYAGCVPGKMTPEVAGRRGWGRHMAGSRFFLSQCWTYKYFWGCAATCPTFRVH